MISDKELEKWERDAFNEKKRVENATLSDCINYGTSFSSLSQDRILELIKALRTQRKWSEELEKAIKEALFGLLLVVHPQHQRAKKELKEALAKKKEIFGE